MPDSITLQLEQLYDALDPILIPGLLYLAVRGWKHLKGRGFAAVVPLVLCLSYVVLFSLAASGWVQERYYRPIIPFAAILGAMGYWCLGKDFPRKKILYPLMVLVLAACLWDGMRDSLRGHRRAQTLAGVWLRRHDPDYDGLVISNYSQPVYYAGMRYFDPMCEGLFDELRKEGYRFKYIIVDGDETDRWYARHARQNGWQLIYTENERNIHIYQNPG
jgi:hypothetical protein